MNNCGKWYNVKKNLFYQRKRSYGIFKLFMMMVLLQKITWISEILYFFNALEASGCHNASKSHFKYFYWKKFKVFKIFLVVYWSKKKVSLCPFLIIRAKTSFKRCPQDPETQKRLLSLSLRIIIKFFKEPSIFHRNTSLWTNFLSYAGMKSMGYVRAPW